MGRIKNKALYPLKASPTVDDYLIGTDFESGETVTFTVNSISGEASTVTDDNRFIEINYGKVVGDGISSPDVASAINSIPLSIEAVFDEIPFFSGVVYDGVRSYYNTYVIVGKGKGTYGVGGNITVTNAELRIIASTLINSEDYVTPDPNAVLTDLGDITGTSLLDTLNAATPFAIAAGENRYWKYLDGGQEYIYGFSGAAGTYGAAQPAILITELFLVRDSASAIVTSTADLLNNGSDATSTYVEADELGAAAFDNDYNSLNNLPSIPAAVTLTSQLTNDGADATSTYVEADELGAAAFSNDYNDLTNIPTFGGLDNQIPFVNATNNGFEYSSNFIYNGSKLHLLNVANSIEIGDYVGNVEGMQLNKNSLIFVDGNTVADIIVNSAGFKVDRYDTQESAWYKNDSIVYKNDARTFEQTIVPATIAANHVVTIPNATGTLALTSDLPSLGLSTEIPFMNGTNDDFQYSSNFIYSTGLNSLTLKNGLFGTSVSGSAVRVTDSATGFVEIAYLNTNPTLKLYKDNFGILLSNDLTLSADRLVTFQDADGVIALTSDITGINSGTNTGDQGLQSVTDITNTTTNVIKSSATAATIKADDDTSVITKAYKQHGVFDYNDLATATTPIAVTGGGGYVFLTNDEAGVNTNKLYPPTGVTDVWDEVSDEFDFSELTLGSTIHIRYDLEITTTVSNQEVQIAMDLAIGGVSPYTIPVDNLEFKSAAVHTITKTFMIYIGNADTRDFPAKLKVQSPTNCDVQVNGWACDVRVY